MTNPENLIGTLQSALGAYVDAQEAAKQTAADIIAEDRAKLSPETAEPTQGV